MQMFSLFEGFCPPVMGEPKGVNVIVVTENRGSRCAKETVLRVVIYRTTLKYNFRNKNVHFTDIYK